MNSIPANLLQRMDVVTGGASATYGSCARASVVNLILNNKLTGINVDLGCGVNGAGDGGSPLLVCGVLVVQWTVNDTPADVPQRFVRARSTRKRITES